MPTYPRDVQVQRCPASGRPCRDPQCSASDVEPRTVYNCHAIEAEGAEPLDWSGEELHQADAPEAVRERAGMIEYAQGEGYMGEAGLVLDPPGQPGVSEVPFVTHTTTTTTETITETEEVTGTRNDYAADAAGVIANALDAVESELTYRRSVRAEANDRIRTLVAQQALLRRQHRIWIQHVRTEASGALAAEEPVGREAPEDAPIEDVPVAQRTRTRAVPGRTGRARTREAPDALPAETPVMGLAERALRDRVQGAHNA